MAEVHVLMQQARRLTLVMHIPIPAGNNSAGIAWQTALANSGLVVASVLKAGDGTGGTISTAEAASLASGAIFERSVSYDMADDFDGLSTANKNARIDDVFNTTKVDLLAELQARLKYCGYTRVVP